MLEEIVDSLLRLLVVPDSVVRLLVGLESGGRLLFGLNSVNRSLVGLDSLDRLLVDPNRAIRLLVGIDTVVNMMVGVKGRVTVVVYSLIEGCSKLLDVSDSDRRNNWCRRRIATIGHVDVGLETRRGWREHIRRGTALKGM